MPFASLFQSCSMLTSKSDTNASYSIRLSLTTLRHVSITDAHASLMATHVPQPARPALPSISESPHAFAGPGAPSVGNRSVGSLQVDPLGLHWRRAGLPALRMPHHLQPER